MTFPTAIRRALPFDLPAIYDGELDYIRQIEPQQETNWRNGMRFDLRQWTSDLDRMFIAGRDGAQTGCCFWEIHGDDAVLASIYILPGSAATGSGVNDSTPTYRTLRPRDSVVSRSASNPTIRRATFTKAPAPYAR
ncbi:hypothetical protein [Burkholderia cepacia]|uniref:hypothetical protein n=1 Tax=Burkholderia cepacia TaxID=292 RepID=UPI001C9850F0|nr:hypothetical protein [Burkholderia cepacia]MBY4804631.1 hypothetical protein [Burkholderia cepacia]MCA8326735.1 hypothetical protein [Burkholderia cepacia]